MKTILEHRMEASKATLASVHNFLTAAINGLAEKASDEQDEQALTTLATYVKSLIDFQKIIKEWHDGMDDAFLQTISEMEPPSDRLN